MKKSWVLMMAVGVVWSAGGWAEAAENCAVRPTCAELGYDEVAANCKDENMIKCPFDDNYVFCRDSDTKVCELGDILYSDLNCYFNSPSDVVEIGVVFDPRNRLARSMERKTLIWALSYDRNEVTCSGCKLANCPASDGKAQTLELVKLFGDKTNYAAGYCYNYTTEGTQKGDWFLPGLAQASKILIGNSEGALWTSDYDSEPCLSTEYSDFYNSRHKFYCVIQY